MIGHMLNDLAKAIRRWTEKKCQRWQDQVGMALVLPALTAAGGGSNPCWSTQESQVRPAERQRAPTTKTPYQPSHRVASPPVAFRRVALETPEWTSLLLVLSPLPSLRREKSGAQSIAKFFIWVCILW